jgi:hypothetical protein
VIVSPGFVMPLGDVESLNVPSLVIVIDGVVHITSTSASLLVSELPDRVRYFCFVRTKPSTEA